MRINMRLPYDLIIECKLQPIWLHTHTHGSAGILSKKKNSIQSSWKEWNKKNNSIASWKVEEKKFLPEKKNNEKKLDQLIDI